MSPVLTCVARVRKRHGFGAKEHRIQHAKLQKKIVNFAKLADLPAVDDVCCALGTTIKKAGSQTAFRRVDFEYSFHLAERSLVGGAQQFLLVSSVGANSNSSNFYLRTKGELEDAIRQLPFSSIHIFRPSFLIGDRKEQRTGERLGVMSPKP